MLRPSTPAAVLVVSMVLALPQAGRASGTLPPSNLRPQSVRVAAWLARGVEGSATFRALVERINRGDVLVYIDAPFNLRSGLSASLTWMAAIPGGRLVRASLRRSLNDREAVAMLGHELQHVVELLDHPEVRSEAALSDLYHRIGHASTTKDRHWDTPAARRAGEAVRIELLG